MWDASKKEQCKQYEGQWVALTTEETNTREKLERLMHKHDDCEASGCRDSGLKDAQV
jgi:hypothetical protein